ncbi:thiamine pyrophosphate-binding protein, partial [Kitasatospora phosalacinea]|uniref:thiamine pyrophosphate-binding protein n=1 Tax=Kitasatospora phosalacinea TaxID=2065 RepID=UPI00365AD4C3
MTQLTDPPAATDHAPAAVPAPARTATGPATSPANAEGAHLTGAEALVRSLETLGVDTVFGIPGGAILPAYDPLMDSTQLRHVLVRHEQGAGHAATGYAQATGRVGVCMATSGPGATNLVTP